MSCGSLRACWHILSGLSKLTFQVFWEAGVANIGQTSQIRLSWEHTIIVMGAHISTSQAGPLINQVHLKLYTQTLILLLQRMKGILYSLSVSRNFGKNVKGDSVGFKQ